MSSGLPINTFSQASEYRKRYLATLALIAQNDAMNLQANQVFRQTGQPSRPPDTRSTTEKMADIEKLKVELRTGFLEITDGTQANEAVEQLTPDEVMFASQQLPVIINEVKPRFSKGIPALALVGFIRALRRKFLATNGVSFTAQEATAQQILNALQAGRNVLNAPSGPFGPEPSIPEPSVHERRMPSQESKERFAMTQEDIMSRMAQEQNIAEEEEIEQMGQEDIPEILKAFRSDPNVFEALINFGPNSIEEWEAYPRQMDFSAYGDRPIVKVEFLKMWARKQSKDVRSKFKKNWNTRKTILGMKNALTAGVIEKLSGPPPEPLPRTTKIEPSFKPPSESSIFSGVTDPEVGGFGIRRPNQPSSRFPSGREILGYGLKKQSKSKNVVIDMTRGLAYEPAKAYVPFGRYIINPNKLASGVFDLKTIGGSVVHKYPPRSLSAGLSKLMNRIIGGRMPDEYDFNEMDIEDQNFLYNLAKDSKIMDRLKLPTPKRSKEGEELNRFEILKGQIVAGNDNKELVKEFKQILLRFSNDGRIKKSEAREILLDLVAMGY